MNYRMRQFLVPLLLLFNVLLFGSLGYLVIEPGWSLIDAFYMTVITITTVGFGEIRRLTPAGRIFTVLVIFSGWTTLAFTGAKLAKLIIENEINMFFGRKKMHNTIMKMRDHYIVCGFGRIGRSVCEALSELEIPFVVIEIEESSTASAEKKGYCILRGNATEDDLLKEAGLERARGIVAALNSDARNLFISLAARELNPDIFIISRCEESGVEHRILQGGANMVVSPLNLGGRHIAELIKQHYRRVLDDSSVDPRGRAADLLGFSLKILQQPEKKIRTVEDAVRSTGALTAVAVLHADRSIDLNPAEHEKLEDTDSVVLLVRDKPAKA